MNITFEDIERLGLEFTAHEDNCYQVGHYTNGRVTVGVVMNCDQVYDADTGVVFESLQELEVFVKAHGG